MGGVSLGLVLFFFFVVTVLLIDNFTIFIPTSMSFCGTQDDKIEEITA